MAFVGVFGLAVFTVAFLVHFGIASSSGKLSSNILLFPDNWGRAIAAVPNVVYSLTFMYSFFPVFKGMRQSSDKKMKRTTLTATIINSVFYLIIGICGYWLLGENVNGSFLESLLY